VTLVFYLRYLRNELLRRRTRTILTTLGLAVGVALVIVIASLAQGLDKAQTKALNPLSSIGTDLTVTLSPQQDTGGGGFGGGGFGGGRELIQANQSAITDLSKLGKPGTHFVHDFFLPGTQLTFPQSQAQQIASLPGVAGVSSGLILSGVHQEGTVPKIVARIRTGGQTFRIRRNITPLSQAELTEMQACLQKAGVGGRAMPGGQGGGKTPNGGGGSRLGGQGGRGGFFSTPAARACLPARLRQFQTQFTTPQQTLQQVVAPPQTNIESSSYSIGGVDTSNPQIGVVTPSLVTGGRFIESPGEALVASSYAARSKLKVGSKLDLNGTKLTVVGLVRPPLGGHTADVYVALSQLQKLASQKSLVNVVLVRAADGASVGDVQKEIAARFPNAQVASAKQVADSIGGSLVDAANLSNRLGVALAILAAVAAFLVAALLTLSSVGKRVRELGTLKALGWTQRLVVRQVVGESLTQGLAGGLIGVVLGVAIAAAIGAFGPTLTASSQTGGGDGFFGLGAISSRTVSDTVSLTTTATPSMVVIGLGVAILGGLVAGGAGAMRAARLRPADALRQVE
jgi:putative ABC transport system permease protein